LEAAPSSTPPQLQDWWENQIAACTVQASMLLSVSQRQPLEKKQRRALESMLSRRKLFSSFVLDAEDIEVQSAPSSQCRPVSFGPLCLVMGFFSLARLFFFFSFDVFHGSVITPDT
jgi:hypothetical protein